MSENTAAQPAPADGSPAPAAEASKVSTSGYIRKKPTNIVIAKLFTKEDPLYFHKIFGLFAVLSFVYRYFFVLPRFGHLGFSVLDVEAGDVPTWWPSWFNHATVISHLMLSCSSFIFHVLPFRIKTKPLVIYEEYRAHACLFSMRALFGYFWDHFLRELCGVERGSIGERVLMVVLILLHHVVVDLVTMKYGNGYTAVRNGSKSRTSYLVPMRRMYSYYQITALASQLLPHARTADIGWNALIAIQSSAFLMTLHRKGLIVWSTHAIVYSLCLLLSFIVMGLNFGWMIFLLTMGVFFFRIQFNLNKYVLWIGYAVLMGLLNVPGDAFQQLSPVTASA